MIKKIIHSVVWLLILAWFIIIMGFVSNRTDEIMCKRINIEISDSSTVKFITATQVREIISASEFDIQGYPLSGINTRSLELMLEQNPYVEKAEAYTTVEGDLFLDLKQRTPVLRTMPNGQDGWYIDSKGVFLPLSSNYAPMVLLVSGDIFLPEDVRMNGLQHPDSIDPEYRDLFQLLEFAKYIDKHKFWKSQIIQVYRDASGDYELIPRVGAHQILFGSLENYHEKLRNLELLYEQGFQKYGWNTYNKINLKYSNQVICTKR